VTNIIDEIKTSVKVNHRFLKDSAFCSHWKANHEDCTGCSSQVGCAVFSSILNWEIYKAFKAGKI